MYCGYIQDMATLNIEMRIFIVPYTCNQEMVCFGFHSKQSHIWHSTVATATTGGNVMVIVLTLIRSPLDE